MHLPAYRLDGYALVTSPASRAVHVYDNGTHRVIRGGLPSLSAMREASRARGWPVQEMGDGTRPVDGQAWWQRRIAGREREQMGEPR